MSTTTRTTEADAAESGIVSHRIVDPLDGSGRMTVETPGGEERTVVDCLDGLVAERLSERGAGSTVRLELSPTPADDGYVAARVLPGGLPAL
ncbi:hypothetical protein ACFQMA_11335 [Halosimplex aquaticum]|uniref:DUF7999 domain-containing protein n=1 Tax=Halosimplex aquaticum TaxID=3026162 RepID=A0ABD5Y3U0_9EURY|nr:hypothetical protein [Halosimplex aquaticum]